MTPEVDIYRVSGVYGNGLNGPYEKPYPIDDGRYFVSNMGVIQLRDYDGNCVSVLCGKDGMGFYSAQAIRPTPTPARLVHGATTTLPCNCPQTGVCRATGRRSSCRTFIRDSNRPFSAAT